MAEWWRDAVVYQVYVRSFADSDGDGIGDLPGVRSRLPYLKELGVDALWLTPFYASPMADGGYDVADYRDVDPMFGTLADFDALVEEAHALDLRVIVDIVPNHCSDQHAWFRAAVAAGPGSPERDRFHFRPVDPEHPDTPPNDWPAAFGGPAWSRVTEPDGSLGEWYLHIFTPEQPDFDWDHPDVTAEFESVLRFWLDRGVDGFRIDVAHGLVKEAGLPSLGADLLRRHLQNNLDPDLATPMFDQPGIHEIYRGWRSILDEYPGERMTVGEVWLGNAAALARYLRPDELNQAFNFRWVFAPWDPAVVHEVVSVSLRDATAIGAPATWVLSNHDVYRPVTRLRRRTTGARPRPRHRAVHARPARARPTSTRARSSGCPRCSTCPRSPCRTPPGSAPATRSADATAAGCRSPGRAAESRTASVRRAATPGSPSRRRGASCRSRRRTGSRARRCRSSATRSGCAARRSPLGTTISWVDGLPADVLGYRRGSFLCLINFAETAAVLPQALAAELGGAELLVSSDSTYASGPLTPLSPTSTSWFRTP